MMYRYIKDNRKTKPLKRIVACIVYFICLIRTPSITVDWTEGQTILLNMELLNGSIPFILSCAMNYCFSIGIIMILIPILCTTYEFIDKSQHRYKGGISFTSAVRRRRLAKEFRNQTKWWHRWHQPVVLTSNQAWVWYLYLGFLSSVPPCSDGISISKLVANGFSSSCKFSFSKNLWTIPDDFRMAQWLQRISWFDWRSKKRLTSKQKIWTILKRTHAVYSILLKRMRSK